MELPVLPTTLVSSYPKPSWLKILDKDLKFRRGWRKTELLEEAYNDAVAVIVKELEEVGIDIPTDGGVRNYSDIEYLVRGVEGIKFYGLVRVWGNQYVMKPVIVSRLRHRKPVLVEDYLYLRKVARSKVVKVSLAGVMTLADWSFNEYYSSREELISDLIRVVSTELRALEEAGAQYVQLDEPSLLARPEDVELGIEVVNKVVKGLSIKVGLHVCYGNYSLLKPYIDELKVSQLTLAFADRGFKDLEFLKYVGKEVGLGVVSTYSDDVEDPVTIAKAIEKAMKYVRPECIYVNPDCGMRSLPRRVAREKLKSMVEGVRIIREELRRKGLEVVDFRVRDSCP